MKFRFILVSLAALSLVGCATPKSWMATDGSRADATVVLSYEYNAMYEQPVVDDSQGLQVAIDRCKSWGYTSAEAFGGNYSQEIGKSMIRVMKKYQCHGRGSSGR